MGKKLKLYWDKLTRDQLYRFFLNTLANARHLYDEAKLLYTNNMLPRSYFLLCICIEEIGKAYIISAFATLENSDWQEFWRGVRDHKFKSGFMYFTENNFIHNEVVESFLNDISTVLSEHEAHKLACLYSDAHILDVQAPILLDPSDFVSIQLLESTIKLTDIRLNNILSIIKDLFPMPLL